MDFSAYSNWNPFVISIKGQKIEEKKLQVVLKTKKGKHMNFEPIVLKCKKEDEFRWRGKLGIKGIFDGEHYFSLDHVSPEQTILLHGEFFSGILVGLMSSLLKDTKESFEQMNVALKKRCEEN